MVQVDRLSLHRLLRSFGADFPRVGNIELPLTAFYKLAAPSAPEAAREEVIERATCAPMPFNASLVA